MDSVEQKIEMAKGDGCCKKGSAKEALAKGESA